MFLATHHLPEGCAIMPQSKGSDCLDEFKIMEMSLTCNLDELARILNRETNQLKQQKQAIFAAQMMSQQTEENGAPLTVNACLWHIFMTMLEQATAELTEFANDSIKELETANIILVSKDNEIKQLEDALVLLQRDYEKCSKMSDKGYSGVQNCPAISKPKKRRTK
jgi:hypothetical protein